MGDWTCDSAVRGRARPPFPIYFMPLKYKYFIDNFFLFYFSNFETLSVIRQGCCMNCKASRSDRGITEVLSRQLSGETDGNHEKAQNNRCFGRDSKWAPSEYEYRSSPLPQPIPCFVSEHLCSYPDDLLTLWQDNISDNSVTSNWCETGFFCKGKLSLSCLRRKWRTMKMK
jgi:hypothetical protein